MDFFNNIYSWISMWIKPGLHLDNIRYNSLRFILEGFLGPPESHYKNKGVGSPRVADLTASEGAGN